MTSYNMHSLRNKLDPHNKYEFTMLTWVILLKRLLYSSIVVVCVACEYWRLLVVFMGTSLGPQMAPSLPVPAPPRGEGLACPPKVHIGNS